MAYATPKETALLDTPVMPHGNFSGYYRKKDPTLLPLNALTYPTTNVFMPDGDKIVPRKGIKVLGQEATQNSGIIGHAKKYKNRAGIEMEVRVWTDNTITLSGISGTFQVGEVVYGDFGDATIVSIDGNVLTVAWNPDSAYRFESGVVTGLSSGATGTLEILRGDVIEVFYDGLWRQITLNQNPLTSSLHEYYFTQWMDTNIDNSISANSNRLIWVMGRNLIRSWTGGIAVVNTVNPGVSIAIQNVTWNEIGFIPPAQGGTEFITINGKEYEATGGWNTGILTLTDTTGISPGDLVFQGIQEKEWFNDFDVVSSFKNYPVYGNWKLQKVFIGNNFNHPSSENIVTSNALQNDLIIDSTANYTGTGSHIYKVTITDVNPEFENSRFYGGGEGSLNDGWWITSGYTGSAGVTNNYKISIVGNATIGLTSGVGFSVGDIVSQSSTGSMAVIIAKYYLVGPAYNVIALRMLTNTAFDVSVAVTNLSTSATEIPIVSNAQNWIQASKNGVQIAVQTDPIFGVVNIPPLQYSVSLGASGDNLSIQFSNYLGHAIGDVFELTINKGGNDTFQYQIDNGAPVTGVAITGGAQSLGSGVVVKFNSKTGHSVGDYWDIQVDQAVTNAYANFYYTTPVRKPGEGYIGNLPANFWAMAPQEDNMYINDALGKWGYLDTEFSADLTSEVIKYVPLKNATQNKVIYPYMIGYSDNEIIFVTEDKRLDMIGRKKFVELPQVGYLSDDVKYDFLEASFTKGSIEFTNMRIFITSPHELKMFCYDLAMRYWQPPQLIPENAMLSIVGNDLISHSNLNNVTNTLFVGTNDNGSAFPIIIRTGYNQYGNRWRYKRANSLFVEGYMQGNPILDVNYLLDVNGCAGIVRAEVDPVYCIAPDNAPIGAGTLGSHSLGSDQPSPIPYFRWIGVGQTPFDFYLGAFDLRTETKDPQFEILTLGTNAIYSMQNNSTLKRGQLKII